MAGFYRKCVTRAIVKKVYYPDDSLCFFPPKAGYHASSSGLSTVHLIFQCVNDRLPRDIDRRLK